MVDGKTYYAHKQTVDFGKNTVNFGFNIVLSPLKKSFTRLNRSIGPETRSTLFRR